MHSLSERNRMFGSASRGDFAPATSGLDFLVEFDDLEPPRTQPRPTIRFHRPGVVRSTA